MNGALLHGELADSARRVVGRLAARLLAAPADDGGGVSLSHGHVGAALAHLYLRRAAPRPDHARALRKRRAAALAWVAAHPTSFGLYGGFTGLGWLNAHIAGGGKRDDNEAIDAALAELLNRAPWVGPLDLCFGLVGIGVYLLERLPRPEARSMLARLVDHLSQAAVELSSGVTWNAWQPPGPRAAPPPTFELGVAHGQAGIIALLGAIVGAGIGGSAAASLLEKAVAWLLAQQLAKGAPSRFPRRVAPGHEPEPTRLGWCAGDPGIAAALLVAATATGQAAWIAAAREVALHAARRDLATSGCDDAGICHGALGNAHVFARIYRMTGDEIFACSARRWLEHGLNMPGRRGFGGLTLYEGATFLNGGAGAALVLASALERPAREPAWDRLLLLSHAAG